MSIERERKGISDVRESQKHTSISPLALGFAFNFDGKLVWLIGVVKDVDREREGGDIIDVGENP